MKIFISAFIIIVSMYCTANAATPASGGSRVTNLLLGDSKVDVDLPDLSLQSFSGKDDKLSPEARDALKKHQELITKMDPKIREELRNYRDASKALYEKLTPEAKSVLKQRLDAIKSMSPSIRKELVEYTKATLTEKEQNAANHNATNSVIETKQKAKK